jgi:hypothetical protein
MMGSVKKGRTKKKKKARKAPSVLEGTLWKSVYTAGLRSFSKPSNDAWMELR